MDKPAVALCGKCNQKASFTIEPRPVEGLAAVTEYVVACGNCGAVTHSCWMNAALERLQKGAEAEHQPARRAHEFRRHKRKFDEFQAVMERRQAKVVE